MTIKALINAREHMDGITVHVRTNYTKWVNPTCEEYFQLRAKTAIEMLGRKTVESWSADMYNVYITVAPTWYERLIYWVKGGAC